MSHSSIFAGKVGELSVSGGIFTVNNYNQSSSSDQVAPSTFPRTTLGGSALPTSSAQPFFQRMPSKPHIFDGRGDLVREVACMLCDETKSRVCILGPGGMGKTSLALAVVESPNVQSRYSGRSYWVPCVEATTPSLLLHILHLHLRINAKATIDILDDILFELKRSTEPLLLLLDNFETPWIPVQGTQSEVADILYRLDQLDHVTIFMTMRGTEPPCEDIHWYAKKLHPVDEGASRLIFHDNYPRSRQDPDVDELLAAVGHMPYAVMLLAKLGRKGRSTAKQIFHDWKRSGTGMMSSSAPEENMNRSISLSVNRPFIQQNPDALTLLATLSLLPAGTSRENLEQWWAPSVKSWSSAIAALLDAALLMMNEDDRPTNNSTKLFILPVVQSYMFVNNLIPEPIRRDIQAAYCQYIVDHFNDNPTIIMACNYDALLAEDTNIRSIFLTSSSHDFLVPIDKVIEALLSFSRYCRLTRPSVDVARHTLYLANSLGEARYRAESLYSLGVTYEYLGMFDIAQQPLTEAYMLFTRMPANDTYPRLPALVVHCGTSLAVSRWKAGWSNQTVIDFLRNLQSTFDSILGDHEEATLLRALGYLLCDDGQVTEGLDCLQEATDMFKRMGNPLFVAISLSTMSMIYLKSSQLTKALELSHEALQSVRQFRDHQNYRFPFIHGSILIALNRDSEAFPIMEACLANCELAGDMVGASHCLGNLGYIYMRRGDYRNSFTAYEAAIGRLEKIGVVSNTLDRYREILKGIKQKGLNPNADIQLL